MMKMKNYITLSYIFGMIKGIEELLSEDNDNDYLKRKLEVAKRLHSKCIDNNGVMTKKLYWDIVNLDNDIYENYISSFDNDIVDDYLDCDYMPKSQVWYLDLSSFYRYRMVLHERPIVWTTKKNKECDYNL